MYGFGVSTLISVVAGLVLSAPPAQATPVSYSAGFATPTEVIDFTGPADGVAIGSYYSGVTFSGLFSYSGNPYSAGALGPVSAPGAVNISGATTFTPFTITFATVQTDAVFFLYTDGSGTTITSSLNGSTVETVNASTYANDGNDFFGFTGSSFDTLTVAVSGSGAAVIDNLEIGLGVPEPSSNAIMLAGLAGLMMIGGRRRI